MSAEGHISLLWYTAIDPYWFELKQARVRNVDSRDHFGAWLHHVIMTEVGGDCQAMCARFSSPKEWKDLKRVVITDEYVSALSATCDVDNVTLETIASCGPTGLGAYQFFSHRADYDSLMQSMRDRSSGRAQ